MRLGGVTTRSFEIRSKVAAFGAVVTNHLLDASVGEDEVYVGVATELHVERITMARVTIETLTLDCKSTSTAPAHLYRLKNGEPRKAGERGACAQTAGAVVRCSTARMARMQAERYALLRVTKD
jgi:hypothetical protein